MGLKIRNDTSFSIVIVHFFYIKIRMPHKTVLLKLRACLTNFFLLHITEGSCEGPNSSKSFVSEL